MARSGLLSLLLAATLSSTAYAEPVSQPTTRPAGKWHCYYNVHAPQIVAANKDHIWFQRGLVLWRYDVKSQQVEVVSPLDGIRFSLIIHCALAADGRFAASVSQGANYLWTPGKGWQALPKSPGGFSMGVINFDEKGQMWGYLRHQDGYFIIIYRVI